MKRRPRQARSRERVDAILDATGVVLRDEGYDALNTNRIAAEAGVPVGSVYQYFDNKADVVRQLALRSLTRLDALVDELVAAEEQGIEALVDLTLDSLAELYRTEPGFVAVWLGRDVSSELVEEDHRHDEQLARRLEPMLGRAIPTMKPTRRRVACRLMVQVAGSIAGLSTRVGPRRSKTIVAEGKLMLKAYLRDAERNAP